MRGLAIAANSQNGDSAVSVLRLELLATIGNCSDCDI